jgi:hypothetical protein
MKRENSLLDYLRAKAPQTSAPLIKRLERDGDIQIPAYFRHTFDLASSLEVTPRDGDDNNVSIILPKSEQTRRYPGLNKKYIKHASPIFQPSSGEIVDESNYPRLYAVFHSMCDALGFKPHGEYPDLVMMHSDLPKAAAIHSNDGPVNPSQKPAVFISSAFFDIASSRMIIGLLFHELHHLTEVYNNRDRQNPPSGKTETTKTDAQVSAIIDEEYAADALALHMGISADEMAEAHVQSIQLQARQKEFCNKIKQLCDETFPNTRQVPTGLLQLLCKGARMRQDINSGSAVQRLEKERQSKHPSHMDRVERMMDSPVPEGATWVDRFGEELNRGTLLDRGPTPPGAGFLR